VLKCTKTRAGGARDTKQPESRNEPARGDEHFGTPFALNGSNASKSRSYVRLQQAPVMPQDKKPDDRAGMIGGGYIAAASAGIESMADHLHTIER
jgi:hypothetical protein